MEVDKSIKKIRDFIGSESCRSRTWLAKEAGVAEFALRNVMDKSWNPMAATLKKLERVVAARSRP